MAALGWRVSAFALKIVIGFYDVTRTERAAALFGSRFLMQGVLGTISMGLVILSLVHELFRRFFSKRAERLNVLCCFNNDATSKSTPRT